MKKLLTLLRRVARAIIGPPPATSRHKTEGHSFFDQNFYTEQKQWIEEKLEQMKRRQAEQAGKPTCTQDPAQTSIEQQIKDPFEIAVNNAFQKADWYKKQAEKFKQQAGTQGPLSPATLLGFPVVTANFPAHGAMPMEFVLPHPGGQLPAADCKKWFSVVVRCQCGCGTIKCFHGLDWVRATAIVNHIRSKLGTGAGDVFVAVFHPGPRSLVEERIQAQSYDGTCKILCPDPLLN